MTTQQQENVREPRRPNVIGYWATMVSNTALKELGEALAPYEMGMMQFVILNMCSRGEANTVSGIARLLPFDAPAISRAADTLVRRGLMERRRSRADRRVVMLHLTEEGRELSATLAELALEAENRVTAGITASERDSFITIARKIVTGFRIR